LKFIQVPVLKYKEYKSYLEDMGNKSAKISVCKNNKGANEVYIGPFDKQNDRDRVLKEINKEINQAFEVELTQEEFDRRCSF
jgi:hypothetical protein